MEVVLKKTKITPAILKQVYVGVDISAFDEFEILGWCYFKDYRYFVFHKDGLLKMMVFDTTLELKGDWEQIDNEGNASFIHRVWIKRPNRPDYKPKFETEGQAEEYRQKYQSIIDEGKKKGQFYI